MIYDLRLMNMEKAILKTLIYASIFDYPLKAHEILKWLIFKKGSLREIEKGLNRLLNKKQIGKYKDYFFLIDKKNQVLKRIKRNEISKGLIFKAKVLTQALKLIPWIKLVGVSGALAMQNSSKKDDIDLFIIAAKNRLWLSRLFAVLIFTLLAVRRSRKTRNVSGKFCLNIFLTEDNLKQKRLDLYTAHEVLQMRVLWEREGMYGRFLEENNWAFKYLPNWTTGQSQISTPIPIKSGPIESGSKLNPDLIGVKSPRPRSAKRGGQNYNSNLNFFNILEVVAKWVQLKYMGQPKGMERIEDGALYFHPQDYRNTVLTEYKKQLKMF